MGKHRPLSVLLAERKKERELEKEQLVLKSDHPLYSIWAGMKQRCYNPKHSAYKYYGGRGITVCKRWLGSFDLFIEDMGDRPEGYTLERVFNNLNYDPDNCIWADYTTQANNRNNSKRNNNWILELFAGE